MSTSRSALLLATCLAFSPAAFADDSTNLGFEDGRVGHLPPDWVVPAPGWKAALVEEKAAAGARSLKLSKAGESEAPFGNVMHSTPAGEMAGRHATLTARIRVEGGGHAQMWLRVDRPNKATGAFDNMGDRPIQPGDWTDATIEADIDADAAALNIGFMALGGATLFIDEVKLTLSDAKTVAQQASPPRPLSPQDIENLVAAAKLLSYVRFFHPSDQAVGVASWDHFAVDLMERAEPAASATELAQRLNEAIAGVAPTVEIWAGTLEQGPPSHADWPAGAKQFVQWLHHGAGRIARSGPNQVYRSTVEKEPLASLPANLDLTFFVRNLGAGVCCRVPILVYADDTGTLPHGGTPDARAKAADLPKLTALNRSTRLAGVALAWGVFQHFYPYFDVVETNWEAALPAALAEAAVDADELAYLGTLRELVAKLHDGHGGVMNPALMAKSMLPLALEWAGSDLVIVGKHAGVPDNVSIGDVVVSIDGRSSEDCFRDVSKWISAATDGWSRWISNRMLVVNLPTADPVTLVLRKPSGESVNVELARVAEFTPNTASVKRPDNGAELSPGLLYFNLDAAEPDAFNKLLPSLAAARGIIFDLRGYPGGAAYQLVEHLITEPATSARWCIPTIRQPDRAGMGWNESGWSLRPQTPHLNAKIAFLTDGRAISYAESIMGIVEHYKFGEIIGANTAGTNGNVNPFTVPGGYSISWTGMRVLKHDGTQHHGVGIAPTVPVTPTAKGIAEGRDEVLEKAVEVMKAKIAAGA